MSYSGSGEGTCAIRNGRQLVRRFVEETGRRGEGDITIPLPFSYMHFIYPLGTMPINYIINILSFSLAFLHHDHDRVILILILIRLFRLCLQEDPGGGKGGASGEL